MEFRKLAWVLGAALTVGVGGMSAIACSSSNSGGGDAGSSSGSGSGSSSGSSSGGMSDATTGGDDGATTGTDSGSGSGGSSDAGAGTDCGKLPSLHQNPAGDIYCGYGADGGTIDCTTGSQCCLGGSIGGGQFAPQECSPWQANGSGCTNPDGGGIGIACNQISDCTSNGNGGTACCLVGGKGPVALQGCGYSKATGGSAIVCEGSGTVGEGGAPTATACQSGEIQVCSSNADCPTGTTCQAGKWKIYQIGFCQ